MMTVQEFGSQFCDEQQCGEQLSWHPRLEGFRCPRCGGPSRGNMAVRQVHECARCSHQGSVTAGTIFHKTRGSSNWLVLGDVSAESRQEGHLGHATERGDWGLLSDRLAAVA